jgi:anti-sigma B factor antagonist
MVVERIDKPEYIQINVHGSLDVSTSLEVDNTLESALKSGKKQILINCTDLDYITSPGIGVFTSKIDECEKEEITMVLYGMNEQVMSVFKVLGLDKIIPIVHTLEDAKPYVDAL